MSGLFGLEFDPIKQRPQYPGRTGFAKQDLLTVGNKNNAVSFQVQLGEVDQVTVQIDVDTSTLKAAVVVKTLATVSLKVEGNTIKRVYDVSRGLSISGNAEAIAVDINDDSPNPGGSPDQYRVTISVGRFARPGGPVPPIRTGFNGNIGATSSQVVAIPSGANGVAVYGSQFAGYTVQQLFGDGTSAFSSDVTVGQYIPLVSGAATVRVNNPSGSPVATSVLFSIDG